MGRIERGWEITKQSFAILMSDKQLMRLPFLSGISCLLVSAVILSGGGLIAFLVIFYTRWESSPLLNYFLIWISVFVLYLVNYFLIVFFNVALVSAAAERLAGRPTTIRGAVAKAWERKGKVMQWAILASTVGVILRMVERRLGLVGVLVSRLIGIAWALASYFVAPVLVFENLGPIDALKRSGSIFRETWGEDLVGQFSIGLIFVLLAIVGVVVWTAMMVMGGAMGVYVGSALLLLYCITLGVANAAVEGIFTAALYRFATTNEVPPGFVPETLTMAWRPKKRKF
ncbi:MAG TPA: DUF6159 family protein [Candidatus Acidoferrum sp.]|nr:DUF6159 family protein [Candidatus Acidoferrum sp.]